MQNRQGLIKNVINQNPELLAAYNALSDDAKKRVDIYRLDGNIQKNLGRLEKIVLDDRYAQDDPDMIKIKRTISQVNKLIFEGIKSLVTNEFPDWMDAGVVHRLNANIKYESDAKQILADMRVHQKKINDECKSLFDEAFKSAERLAEKDSVFTRAINALQNESKTDASKSQDAFQEFLRAEVGALRAMQDFMLSEILEEKILDNSLLQKTQLNILVQQNDELLQSISSYLNKQKKLDSGTREEILVAASNSSSLLEKMTEALKQQTETLQGRYEIQPYSLKDFPFELQSDVEHMLNDFNAEIKKMNRADIRYKPEKRQQSIHAAIQLLESISQLSKGHPELISKLNMESQIEKLHILAKPSALLIKLEAMVPSENLSDRLANRESAQLNQSNNAPLRAANETVKQFIATFAFDKTNNKHLQVIKDTIHKIENNPFENSYQTQKSLNELRTFELKIQNIIKQKFAELLNNPDNLSKLTSSKQFAAEINRDIERLAKEGFNKASEYAEVKREVNQNPSITEANQIPNQASNTQPTTYAPKTPAIVQAAAVITSTQLGKTPKPAPSILTASQPIVGVSSSALKSATSMTTSFISQQLNNTKPATKATSNLSSFLTNKLKLPAKINLKHINEALENSANVNANNVTLEDNVTNRHTIKIK